MTTLSRLWAACLIGITLARRLAGCDEATGAVDLAPVSHAGAACAASRARSLWSSSRSSRDRAADAGGAVSYTHLTLPTILLV